MRLFLVRHGETDVNRVLGHGVTMPAHDAQSAYNGGNDTNVPLNPNGVLQSEKAAKKLPDHISLLMSSPLLRAKGTAEIVCQAKGIPVASIIFRDELTEYFKGTLEYQTLEETVATIGEHHRGAGGLCTYDYTPYGGDSWRTIHNRVSALLDEIQLGDNKNTVVCVTSSGVIRMIYKLFFDDRAPGISAHITIENGSVHEFKL